MKSLEKNAWFIPQSQSHFIKMNLFCFHHAGGSAAFFYDWTKQLTPFVNLIPVQLPGRDTRHGEEFLTDINTIIEHLMMHAQIFSEKPFMLFGHSLGAMIAFELARKLQATDISLPKALIVSGRCSPKLSDMQEKIYSLPDQLFVKRLVEKYGGINEAVLSCQELLDLLLPRLRADIYLSETYKYAATACLEVPIFVMGGTQDVSLKQEDLLDWKQETRAQTNLFMFEGDHFFLESNKKPVLERLNKILANYL